MRRLANNRRRSCHQPVIDQSRRQAVGEEHGLRILVVEDAEDVAEAIVQHFTQQGNVCDHAADLADAEHFVGPGAHDLVILDINLPDGSGLQMLRKMRAAQNGVPVLVLTARMQVDDKVDALDIGADDYLIKPFDLRELEARARAITRRQHGASDAVVRIGNLECNLAARTVRIDGEDVELTRREFILLEAFVKNLNRVLDKDELHSRLYGLTGEAGLNAIEVYVARLRRKLAGADLEITDPARARLSGAVADVEIGMSAAVSVNAFRHSVAFRLGAVMALVLAFMVVGTIIAAGRYGQAAADETFDRLLRGAALQMAERVIVVDGEADIDLPVSAFELLSLARNDRVFYRVEGPQKHTITGYDDLPLPPDGKDGIYNATYKGVPLRAIHLQPAACRTHPQRRRRHRRRPDRRGTRRTGAHHHHAGRAGHRRCRRRAAGCWPLPHSASPCVRWRGSNTPYANATPATCRPSTFPVPTEVFVLVEAINRFMGRLGRRIDAMQNLVADAAHQLRTPITAMRAQAQLALDEKDPVRLERLHRRIYQRSVGLGRLADQLLSHALVSHRADSETLETIDLRRVAMETAREMRAVSEDPIDMQLPDDEVPVKGDFVSLREAMKNLVNNARKYGEPPVRLTVAVSGRATRIDFRS